MVQFAQILLALSVSISGFAFAGGPKDERIQYLFGLLSQQQIQSHKKAWYRGGWPTIVKMRRSIYRDSETNFFIPLQVMLSLDESSHALDAQSLSEMIQMDALVEEMSLRYLSDAKKTNEPSGTVAYWPLLRTPGGRLVRMFKLNVLYSTVRKANVPNDLDTSAQFVLWSLRRGRNAQFVDDFVVTAGEVVDRDRKRIHPREPLWKDQNSGAFLTWAEAEKKKSRLPGKVNDVDCVVNLNVLNALSTWKEVRGTELPPKTENAYQSSCELVRQMIDNGNEARCGVYYERPSQVYLSWARAAEAGARCLESHNEFVSRRAKEVVTVHLEEALEKPNRMEFVEAAIALKILAPEWARDPRIDQKLIQLTESLDSLKLKKAENAFTGKALGFTFDWYSKAAYESLLLEALAR